MPDFDGSTYNGRFDRIRLNKQLQDVWDVMKDSQWRSLYVLESRLGYPTQSISARLRDFRKKKWGAHTVQRRRVKESGTWEYRLFPNPGAEILPRVMPTKHRPPSTRSA